MRRALTAVALAAAFLALPAEAVADPFSVTITSPAPGSTVSGGVPVAAVTEGPVVSVAFDWSADGGTSWTAIATDADGSDGWTASWDTDGFSGAAELRATATDGSATVIATEDLTVDNSAPAVSVTVAPAVFSPNDDGTKDVAAVTVDIREPATLDVEVTDDAGGEVRTLARDLAASRGMTELAWDGRTGPNGGGSTAADGTYTVTAAATDALGQTFAAEADVVVDTTAPTFRWRGVSPEPLLSARPVRFTYRSSDSASKLSVAYTVLDATGEQIAKVDGLRRPTGRRSLRWEATYRNGSPIDPGLYRVRATVADDAGNGTTSPLEPFRSQRPVTSRVWHRVDGAGRRVALTFDDCNDDDAWSDILDILEEHDVQASFFCIGSNVNRYASLARRTLALGETIGSHTSDHANLTTLDYAAIRSRVVYDENAWWKRAEATPAPYFRPPYGAYNGTVVSAAGSAGYLRTILWDVDPLDWQRPGAAVIQQRVLSDVRPGSIVVMHTLPQTADALPGILAGLRERNLEEVSLAQLFKAAGYR